MTTETQPRRRRRSASPARSELTTVSAVNGHGSPDSLVTLASIDPADVSAFRQLGIGEATLGALIELGFSTPTPIQTRAVPPMLEGRDVVGRAQTGTGKTLAFALPIAERLDPALPQVQAIVMVPTRELAMQVSLETARACSGRGLAVVALFGGRRINGDLQALAGGPQVVIGTPGRVIDHLQRGSLKLDSVRIVVLDEADEMLDIGFADDIERILRRTPRQRQTALFSATMPSFIRRMIQKHMVSPVQIAIAPKESTLSAIDQVYYEVSERDKLNGFMELMRESDAGEMTRVLCFRRTQIGVDRLTDQLNRHGVPACGIHGGMGQPERDRVLKSFRDGELQVLIATNVAARGLDIHDVTHVVNYDLPQNTEEYVHRIGRTGRAGRTGTAVTFIGEWDFEGLSVLQRFVGDSLRRGRLSLYG